MRSTECRYEKHTPEEFSRMFRLIWEEAKGYGFAIPISRNTDEVRLDIENLNIFFLTYDLGRA